MKNKFGIFFVCLTVTFLLSGCGGPSEEKIAAAQEAYGQLIAMHNQVVEAHKTINNDSLDAELAALLQEVKQLDNHNLNEMKDDEIDLFIENMNAMAASYQTYLDKIREFKETEEAAVLIPVFFTLSNHTEMTFLNLTLYAKNDTGEKTNVLESTEGLVPEQVLTGLMVLRDTSDSPWILHLENTEEESFEFTLNVGDLKEEGEAFSLTFDSEAGELLLEN